MKISNYNLKYTLISFFLLISFNTGQGGLSPFSPYVILSTLLGVYFFIKIPKFKSYYFIFLLGSMYICVTLYTNLINNESVSVFFRSVFLFFSLFSIYVVNNKNSLIFFKVLVFVLTTELIIRVLFFSNFGNIYGLKSSLIFPDTNFLGIFFVPISLIILKNTKSLILSFNVYSIILFTASRTTWISYLLLSFLYYKSKLFKVFIIFLLVLIPPFIIYIFQDFLIILDGSLATKRDIFLPLLYMGDDTIFRLLFGYGKQGADFFADSVLGRNVYVGHTLYGNILQYGLFSLLLYFSLICFFIFSGFRLFLLIYVFSAGVTGLLPFSYLPLTLIFTRAVIIYYEKI